MIGQQRILVVVPARGGSKGVPLKNLRKVQGASLIARTARLIDTLPWVDRAVVSTDHEQIAAEAESFGLDAPFRRPEALSGDRIGDRDVLTHALLEMERQDGCRYDVIVMLQPTCPLRRPEHVTATVERLVRDQLDAVWTVTASNLKLHPLKQLKIGEDKRLTYYDPGGAEIIARQQLTPVYHRNGAAYAIARQCLLEQQALLGQQSGAVVIEEELISIDTLEDFAAVERQLRDESPGLEPEG
jgi:CMP-N,N'-diacetyllegionaminic acid synthase